MAFASLYVPAFPIQAVLRADPELRGRAVALTEGTPLAKVVAVNELAARMGVAPGMPEPQAAQFGGVEIRRRNQAYERAAHAALLDLSWSFSPRVEDTSPDTIVLDLAGLSRRFGSEEKIAGQLAERASAFGLVAQVAVASNIEAAILAARGFLGVTVISPGQESRCLAGLPADALLPSEETRETLDRWGVRTCGALAALPLLDLSERLGQQGVRLHELARGAYVRSLCLAEPALDFEEEMPLESAVAEMEPLAFLLGRLLGQLYARLASRALAAGALRVRLELDPVSETDPPVRNRALRRAGKTASRTYEQTLRLPVPLRDPRLLLSLLRLQLQADPPAAPVWKITLTAEPARPRVTQEGLFLPASPDPEKLELTIARLAHLVGDARVGSPQLADTHRPGAFCMTSFTASQVSEYSGKQTSEEGDAFAASVPPADGANCPARQPVLGFRVFRPPLPVLVRLRAGRPARVWIRGRRGQVITASGPWRTSGDWWRDQPWQHDEWELEIRFDGPAPGDRDESPAPDPPSVLYRFYYDWARREWFARGSYD